MAFFEILVTGLTSREFVRLGIMEADTFPQVITKLGKIEYGGRSDRFCLPPEWAERLEKDRGGELPIFEIRHIATPVIESLADVLRELEKRGYLKEKS